MDPKQSLLSTRWNVDCQQPHGGQDWRDMEHFVEDFSVTTNPLGPSKPAVDSATKNIDVQHYPASDFEPAWSALARHMLRTKPAAESNVLPEDLAELKSRLILGNGASELIDIVVRAAHRLSTQPLKLWRPGPFVPQYQEYRRACEVNNLRPVESNDSPWDVMCAVNPCNPTGQFYDVDEMKQYIEREAKSGSVVIIDESMMMFKGYDWTLSSLVSQGPWLKTMAAVQNIFVFVIHSWTKVFACPGLRVGSVLTPTEDSAKLIRRMQVPWSLNTLAILYTAAAVEDDAYLSESFAKIKAWRVLTVNEIRKAAPQFIIGGIEWQPFLWINCGDAEVARKLVAQCKVNGVPIRWGRYGYDCPEYVRVAVRAPEHMRLVVDAITEVLK